MSGYWNDPAGTAETLVDGWLRTGDLATRDDNGIFRLRGRVKEMFIRGGYNVYPMEVEGVLLDHPAWPKSRLFLARILSWERSVWPSSCPPIRAHHRRSTISESTGKRHSPITNCRRRSVSSPNSPKRERQDRPARLAQVEAEHPST